MKMAKQENIPTSANSNIVSGFSYTSLQPEIRELVQQQTKEIKHLIRLTAQNLIEIGEKLHEVKQTLGHGYFGLWLKAEFNWSVATATKMMQASRKFKNINFTNLNFSASAIYLLAAPSTPKQAITEALYRSKLGESITYSLAKELVEHHKQCEQEKDEDVIEIAVDPPINQLIEQVLEEFSPMVEFQFFLEYLRREWFSMIRRKKYLSFMVCAIDNLPLNDELDANLNSDNYIVQVLKQTLQRPGDIFSYWGEGTFIILLSLTESEGARQVAEKIQKTFQKEKFKSVDNNQELTMSLIIASLIPSPSSGIKIKTILYSLVNSLKTRQKNHKNFIFTLTDLNNLN
jgi:GGDEF domain-containing protein